MTTPALPADEAVKPTVPPEAAEAALIAFERGIGYSHRERVRWALAAALPHLMPAAPDITDHLARVHARTGGLGLDISTFGSGEVHIRWRRDYGDDGISDERWIEAGSLPEALDRVLAWEDRADVADAAEATDRTDEEDPSSGTEAQSVPCAPAPEDAAPTGGLDTWDF